MLSKPKKCFELMPVAMDMFYYTIFATRCKLVWAVFWTGWIQSGSRLQAV